MSLETNQEVTNFGETNLFRQYLDVEAPNRQSELKETEEIFRPFLEKMDGYSSRDVERADELVSRRLEGAEDVRAERPEVKPMESILCRDWDRIDGKPSIAEDLKRCNPNYGEGQKWQDNCQRTVPTYEMRRRGYDVTAKPYPPLGDLTLLPRRAEIVWKNPEVIKCKGDGREEIESKMKEWGDGARAAVSVGWRNTNFGHLFVAEQIDGKTVFMDPQDGSEDASHLFKWVEDGSVEFWRMDDRDVTLRIRECCREVEKT